MSSPNNRGRRKNYDEDEATMHPSSPRHRKKPPAPIPETEQRQHCESLKKGGQVGSGTGGLSPSGHSFSESPPAVSNVVGLPADEATTNLISALVATDLARQDHKDKVTAAAVGAVMKPRPPPLHRQTMNKTADDELKAAKRRERERGPSVAVAVVTALPSSARKPARNEESLETKPLTGGKSPSNEGSFHMRSPLDSSTQSQSSRSGLDSSSTRSSRDKKSLANDTAMADAKRREREQGPMQATARAPLNRNTFVPKSTGGDENFSQNELNSTYKHCKEDRKPTAKSSSELNSASDHSRDKKNSSAHERMMEAKLAARETGGAASVARTPRPRKPSTEQRKPFTQDDAVTTGYVSSSNDEQMIETMRREHEQGRSVTTAMVRKPPSPPRHHTGDKAKDSLDDAKRREHKYWPNMATAFVARKSTPSGHRSGDDSLPQAKDSFEDTKHRENEQGPTMANALVARKQSPRGNPSDDQTAQNVVAKDDPEDSKLREREQGPALASAVARAPLARGTLDESMGSSHDAMMLKKRREREFQDAPATHRYPSPSHRPSDEKHQQRKSREAPAVSRTPFDRKPLQKVDDDHIAAKRAERERGPAVASAVTTGLCPEKENKQSASSKTDAMAEAKRCEKERGPTLPAAVVGRSAISSPRDGKHSASGKSDDKMAEAKRREKERGPALATATVARPSICSRVESKHPTSSNTDDMVEAKRREKERGPALATATIDHLAISSQKENKHSASSIRNEMAEAKRREKERGPALASACFASISSQSDGQHLASSKSDDMAEAKRREKKQGPSLTTAIVPNRKSLIQHTVDRKTSLGKQHRSSGKDDDDSSSNDSAYALAMARTNMRINKENGKLKEQESGPSLAPATAGEVHPGAFSIVGQELKSKEKDDGPSLAPAFSQVISRSESFASVDDEAIDVDIEAQAGVPVVLPGAFAVQGVSNQDTESECSSSEESETSQSRHDTDLIDGVIVDASQGQVGNSALEAEIYEEVIVEGAVVTADDEEDILDPKAIRRLRMIQLTVLCFTLGAIGLIVGSVMGFSKHGNGIPKVEGWIQVGPDVYGPTDKPQTLFGSALALSGKGTRLAVTAPGTGNATTLNVGEVYIMEEIQNENGTNWAVLDIISGPGPSNEADISVSISHDASWIAVGYPRLSKRSMVQLYSEQGGVWEPKMSPIEGPGDGDSAWFGYAVDLSADGSILAIGAPVLTGPSGAQSGAVQVYQKNETMGMWVKMGSDIVGDAPSEFFGWSVSLRANDGFRVAVGAPVSNDTTGLVRVFDWTGSTWAKVGSDLVGNVPLNRFGESVSLSDDGLVLAVGARGAAFEPGQAQIFRDNDGIWVPDNNIFRGEQSGEGFGSSVSLSSDGSFLTVGAPQNNLFGDGAGLIHVFKFDSTSSLWSQQGSGIGSETATEFGVAVAMSSDGKRVAGGAPTTAFVGSITRAGSALMYDRQEKQQ